MTLAKISLHCILKELGNQEHLPEHFCVIMNGTYVHYLDNYSLLPNDFYFNHRQ